MKKTLTALGLTVLAAILIAACGNVAPTNVGPAMEGFTVLEATSELFGEAASQTEAETSFSAGETAAQRTTASTTRATTTTTAKQQSASTTAAQKPTTTATSFAATTTTRYVPPATTAMTSTTAEYEVMGQAYLDEVIAALNELRAGMGLAPMHQNPVLMAVCLEQAWKMARAGQAFHSENPQGFESVGYYPYQYFTAKALGEEMTYHVANFLQDGYFSVGVAVVRRGEYLYIVQQGDR